jgi:hypothetical protein
MIVENLPPFILLSLTELGLIISGYLVERHYVSRVTVFANALALNVHLLSIAEVSGGLALFADFALLFGLAMLGFYALQKSAPSIAYDIARFPMSSLIIGTVIWSPLDPWYINLVLGTLIQVVHAVLYNSTPRNGELTHRGDLSGQISRFVDTAQIEFVDGNGITQRVDLALTKIESSPWWLKRSD